MQIRADLAAAHERAWRRLAAPGTWWTGTERLAIAAAAREAPACRLCLARKSALAPDMVSGQHDHTGDLDAPLLEVVHRIRTDSPRLTESWLRRMLQTGLSDAHYIEVIGVVATVTAIDSFRDALGQPVLPLPAAQPGGPSRYRPPGAKPGLAWVPTIAPEDLAPTDPPIYHRRSAANIHRAMSLVPDEVVGFFDLDDAMYLPDALMRDFGHEHRALSHAQIELLAARVSALNQCTY